MAKILTSISVNIFDNLEAPIVFLIVAMVLRLANIVLGSIDAMFNKEFDWGKFLSGFEKAFIVAIVILMTIVTLNLFAYGLTLIDITIPDKFVSAFEVVLIIVAWCVDLAIEVVEKIKSMRDLKYIKYEDVQANAQAEKGIG